MSRTLHGRSHRALKHMRVKPAALPVYWIYVSRMNNEGVAWPSARGLARDTGWNKDTCLEGRAWLVERSALERVAGYVRPDWRELAEADRTRKVNLDKSEYYRPTGYFVTEEGDRIAMLYNGGDEPSDVDEKDADVRPRRTPTAPDADRAGRRPRRTELDSRPKGNSRSKGDSNSSLPNGSKPTPTKGYEDVPHEKRTAVIAAWLQNLSAPPVNGNAYGNTTNHKLAAALVRAGYTPEDVTRYTVAMQTDNFWKDKALKLNHVADNLPAWCKAHPAPAATTVPDTSTPDTGPRPNPLPDKLRKAGG